MVKGVQIVVKFQQDGVFVNFESTNKQKVEWDKISDKEYEDMMKTAIREIEAWRNSYINTQMSSEEKAITILKKHISEN